MKGHTKEHFLTLVRDLEEEGMDLQEGHAVYEWTYPEYPGIVYTLFVGPSVLEGDEALH